MAHRRMSPKFKRQSNPSRPNWWKDEYYVRAYEMAKSGMDDLAIGKALGVSVKTFERWLSGKPALREALERGRSQHKPGELREYVYASLSEELRPVWDEIAKVKKGDPGAADTIRRAMSGRDEKAQQYIFLYALASSRYDVSEACYRTNCPYDRWCKWMSEDEEFAKLVEEVEWHKGNYFEAAMMDLVDRRDPQTVKFVNQTFNARRGYAKKSTITHEGIVGHAHVAISGEDFAHLPVEQRRTILEALERKETKAIAGGKIVSDTETED